MKCPESELQAENHAEYLLNYLHKFDARLHILFGSQLPLYQTEALAISTANLEQFLKGSWICYFLKTREKIGLQAPGREQSVAYIVDIQNPKKIDVVVRKEDGNLDHPRLNIWVDFAKIRKLTKMMINIPVSKLFFYQLQADGSYSELSKNLITNQENNFWDNPVGKGEFLFPRPKRTK